MGIFNKKTSSEGLMDIIRCDEPDYLIWKWHPKGTDSGESKRENAIRFGSSLRVKDGSVAVFVYKQKDGTFQDFIEGPFDQMIKTANFPVLASLVGLAYGGDTPFQAEVYFINLAKIIQFKFAVPYFDVFDSVYSEFAVPIAVRGTVSFQISDYKEFIKLHRLEEFTLETLQKQVNDAVVSYIKDVVANAPAEFDIPVISIERRIREINDTAEARIKKRLYDDFGIVVNGLDIPVLDIDKSSEGYLQLVSVTREITAAKVAARAEIDIKEMHDAQNLSVLEREITLEENKYALHKQTQSSNLSAFQIEKQAEVGIEGARALGQMGANGAGSVDLGNGSGGGAGFNPAAMVTSMAVGSAVGQNIVSALNTSMNATPSINSQTPPPIPSVSFFVAKEGQQTGPFDVNTLRTMITSGDLTPDSLVWKQGMSEWQKAGSQSELSGLFPPPIPQ